jgi:tRNA nucleotidyltransferase (CCA-adding enzyme)
LAHKLQFISAERIRDELTKLICAPHPEVLFLLEETGLLHFAYPGDMPQTVAFLQLLHEKCTQMLAEEASMYPSHTHMALALFFAPFMNLQQKQAAVLPNHSVTNLSDLLRSLRFDNKTIQAIILYTTLLHAPIPTQAFEIKQILRQMPKEQPFEAFENLLILCEVIHTDKNDNQVKPQLDEIRETLHSINANNECFTIAQLAINGHDLAALGVPPGKEMGQMLEKLLDIVLREPEKNTRETLTAYCRKLL